MCKSISALFVVFTSLLLWEKGDHEVVDEELAEKQNIGLVTSSTVSGFTTV